MDEGGEFVEETLLPGMAVVEFFDAGGSADIGDDVGDGAIDRVFQRCGVFGFDVALGRLDALVGVGVVAFVVFFGALFLWNAGLFGLARVLELFGESDGKAGAAGEIIHGADGILGDRGPDRQRDRRGGGIGGAMRESDGFADLGVDYTDQIERDLDDIIQHGQMRWGRWRSLLAGVGLGAVQRVGEADGEANAAGEVVESADGVLGDRGPDWRRCGGIGFWLGEFSRLADLGMDHVDEVG